MVPPKLIAAAERALESLVDVLRSLQRSVQKLILDGLAQQAIAGKERRRLSGSAGSVDPRPAVVIGDDSPKDRNHPITLADLRRSSNGPFRDRARRPAGTRVFA